MDSWTSTLQGLADGAGDTFDLRPLLQDYFLEQVVTKGRAEALQASQDWLQTKECCGSSTTCHLDLLDLQDLIDSASSPSGLPPSTFLKIQLRCSVSQPRHKDLDAPSSDPSPESLEDFFEDVKRTFAHLVDGLGDLEWNKLPELVQEHIKNNPKMTAFQVVTLLVPLGGPGLVYGPVLKGLGMAKVGTAAGKKRRSCFPWTSLTL